MANTIKTKKFIKWLKNKGFIFISQKGAHQKWNYPNNPLNRPVIIKSNLDDIPIDHNTTNLQTLGIDKKTFLSEINQI